MTKQVKVDCRMCGGRHFITVNVDRYDRWVSGEGLIQNMLPELSENNKELLISGTCGNCWKIMFGEA